MRKWVILLAAALLLLTVRVRAAEFPREMEQALPKEAESVLDSVERFFDEFSESFFVFGERC